MKTRDIIEFLPMGLLSVIGLSTIFRLLTTNYAFTFELQIGLPLLGIAFILFFTQRTIYKYFYGLLLLAGLMNFVVFTINVVTFHFFGLSIQLLMVPLIAHYVAFYNDELGLKGHSLNGNSDEQKIERRNTQIKRFKNQFDNLSDEAIDAKLNQDLVDEALEALKLIRKERDEILR